MLEMVKELLDQLENDDEYFDKVARVAKKMHDSLVKAGFTEEQAVQIVASQGIGISKS